MNREQVTSYFQEYTGRYNPDDPKIRLKIDHTYRVAGLCERIAKSLSLSEEQKDFAWLAGMLHDIGRFEQVRIYGSFHDGSTVNHAAMGTKVLFQDGEIKNFGVEERLWPLLEKTIFLHNVFRLPDDLTQEELLFCQILRDADKVDIFKVNCDIPMQDIYGMTEEEMRGQPISDEVFSALMRGENVNKDIRKTAADIFVSHIALVYGLVYPESFRAAEEMGYLSRMLRFTSSNPETQRKLDQIREHVEAFMKREKDGNENEIRAGISAKDRKRKK